jgi:hypothetical protein
MKKIAILAFLLLVQLSIRAQVTLPYVTGFDNDQQKAGWQLYKKGAHSPAVPQEWTYTSVGAYTPSQALYHGYPVGATEVSDNWWVSPSFSIPDGGVLDSIFMQFSGFGVPQNLDTVAVYLLVGNSNPDLATSKILLRDYRGEHYENDGVWRNLHNIPLPSQSEACYLSIRYSTISNWLDVKFDNIHISSNTETNISSYQFDKKTEIYPNPIRNGFINVNSGHAFERYAINNIMGQLIQEGVYQSKIDVSNLTQGMYIIRLVDQKGYLYTQVISKNH